MNLQILSGMLEDHLTAEDIEEAQALLDWTYEEMINIRCQLFEAQAEIDALKAQRDELLATFEEVVRISDRKHDAWDAAHAAIAKATGEKS